MVKNNISCLCNQGKRIKIHRLDKIIIPLILLLVKISVPAFSDVILEGWTQLVYSLIGLEVLIITLAIILFPFLWKD